MTEQKTVLSGMRSTGKIHLGNYFGALKNWVELQDRYRCFFFAADWHALTTDYADPSQIAENTIEMVTDWIAAGLDPRALDDLRPVDGAGARRAAPAALDDHAARLARARADLQGADPADREQGPRRPTGSSATRCCRPPTSAIYRANFVPVGEDQASHLEIGREIVAPLQRASTARSFPEPQALLHADAEGARDRRPQDVEVLRQRDQPLGPAGGDPPEVHGDVHRPDAPDAQGPGPSRELQPLPVPPAPVAARTCSERVDHECRAAEIGCVDDKRLLADRSSTPSSSRCANGAQELATADTVLDILLRRLAAGAGAGRRDDGAGARRDGNRLPEGPAEGPGMSDPRQTGGDGSGAAESSGRSACCRSRGASTCRSSTVRSTCCCT